MSEQVLRTTNDVEEVVVIEETDYTSVQEVLEGHSEDVFDTMEIDISIPSDSITRPIRRNLKTFYFVRHGRTQANEKVDEIGFFHPFLITSPMFWDTVLSESGIAHAITIHRTWCSQVGHRPLSHPIHVESSTSSSNSLVNPAIDFSQVQLIVTSPLTRTLQTAYYLFDYEYSLLSNTNIPRIVQPLLREQLYHVSEAGQLREVLEERHPNWNFDLLPRQIPWWYQVKKQLQIEHVNPMTGEITIETIERTYPHREKILEPYEDRNVYTEPNEVFYERMNQLREYLLTRPEDHIICVSHWAVIFTLFGFNCQNCQVEKVHCIHLEEEGFHTHDYH